MEEAVILIRRSVAAFALNCVRRRIGAFVVSETAKADAVVERIMRPFLERVGA